MSKRNKKPQQPVEYLPNYASDNKKIDGQAPKPPRLGLSRVAKPSNAIIQQNVVLDEVKDSVEDANTSIGSSFAPSTPRSGALSGKSLSQLLGSGRYSMGLSRLSKPKTFKSPLLNPPAAIFTPETSLLVFSSEKSTKNEEKSTKRDKETPLKPRRSTNKTNLIQKLGKIEDEESENEEGYENCEDLKVTNENQHNNQQNTMKNQQKAPSDENLEDMSRRSSRARVAKFFVDEIPQKTGKNDEKPEKTGKTEEKTGKKEEKTTKTEENLEELKENPLIPLKKGRGRPKKRKISDDGQENEEKPPELTIFSPEKTPKSQKVLQSDSGRASRRLSERKTANEEGKSPETPEIPVLTPQTTKKPEKISNKSTKVVRKLLSDENQVNSSIKIDLQEEKPLKTMKNTKKHGYTEGKQDGGHEMVKKLKENVKKREETVKKPQKHVINLKNESSSDDDDVLPLATLIKSRKLEEIGKIQEKIPSGINFPFNMELPPLVPLSQKVEQNKMRRSLSLKRTSTMSSTLSLRDDKMAADNMAEDADKMADGFNKTADSIEEEILRNEIVALETSVAVRRKELNVALRQKQRIDELNELTQRWENGSKELLIALHQKITATGKNIDMDELLRQFNAPEDKFKFDAFEYAFV